MYNKKYRLLDNDTIELKLLLADELPEGQLPPKWHVYLTRIGTSKESVLGYKMQTLSGVFVTDTLLVHIELGNKKPFSQTHINRNQDKILAELARVGHITRVYRIEATRCFGDHSAGKQVMIGDKGGYVQRLTNLSHDDTCWISGNAIVCNDATVCDDARVTDNAILTSGAVYEKASIIENAEVHGGNVCGNAIIGGYTRLNAGDRICGYTTFKGAPSPEPIILYKDGIKPQDYTEAKHNFCQFPFKPDRPKLPKRTAGDVGNQFDLE
jgi:hypothetical protein